MSFTLKKFTLIVAGSLVIVLALLGLILVESQSSPKLEVIFFDVGQGDSIFIKTPYDQNILIDGGPDKTVVYQLGRALPFYERNLDLMILTHPHSDHVSGLVEVIRRYKVKKVWYTGALHTSSDFLAWLSLIKEKNILLSIVKGQETLSLGPDLNLQILYPLRDLSSETLSSLGSHSLFSQLNNTSIVLQLHYKETTFLFTGDIEEGVERELLSLDLPLKAQVLKVAHHGSSSSSALEFLEEVAPEIAVIQVGKNIFGHPSSRVLKRLEGLGVKIYRTDQDGNIKIISDGEKIEIKTRK